MKTKKGGFQVSGIRRPGRRPRCVAEPNPELSTSIAVIVDILRETVRSNSSKMKVHPGIFMKTKERQIPDFGPSAHTVSELECRRGL